MSNAKDAILGRIRDALADVAEKQQTSSAIPRKYRKEGDRTRDQTVELFVERVVEYNAVVRRIGKDGLKKAIQTSCRQEQVQKLIVPEGFPGEWLPDDITLWVDRKDEPLSREQLDRSDGVVTTCAGVVAQTGTIILDAGPGQGRRAVTLIPDYHLCIVTEDQIAELLPEAIALFEQEVQQEGPPITMISGPSATSDIELSRVEGVHGPRRLEVLVVAG